MIALKVFREKLFLQHVYIQLWTFLTKVWPHPSPGDQYLYKLEDTLPVIQVSVFSGLMVFFYLKMCKDCSLYFFQCKNFTLLNILNGRIFYMNSSLEPSTQVSLKCIPLHTLFVKINAQSTIIFVLGLCCEITLHHRWTFSFRDLWKHMCLEFNPSIFYRLIWYFLPVYFLQNKILKTNNINSANIFI